MVIANTVLFGKVKARKVRLWLQINFVYFLITSQVDRETTE